MPVDPVTFPKFSWNANTKYLGAFRVPNVSAFDYNGTGLVYNEANDSLFITGKRVDPSGQKTAEISIPVPVNSNNLNDLPRSTFIQNFKEVSEGKYKIIYATSPSPIQIGGYFISGDDLFTVMYPFYDGANKQTVSHFKCPRDLSITGEVVGPYGLTFPGVGKPDRFVNGYFCKVPSSWSSLFTTDAIVGGDPSTISEGASNGADAFLWESSDFADGQEVTPLLYYTVQHPLGTWNQQSELWNGTTACAGVALLDNFRTFLVINHQGIGPFCYGPGVNINPPPIGSCYDPTNAAKGTHAYPYKYTALAYDPIDFLDVMNHTKNPWDLQPYNHWFFDLPFAVDAHALSGFAYDIAGKRFFIEQTFGDGHKPLIHVLLDYDE